MGDEKEAIRKQPMTIRGNQRCPSSHPSSTTGIEIALSVYRYRLRALTTPKELHSILADSIGSSTPLRTRAIVRTPRVQIDALRPHTLELMA
jgi:hypothetical protein